MKIRKANIEDIEQIIELYNELYDTEKIFDLNLNNKYQISDKLKIKIEKIYVQEKKYFW